MGMDKTHEAKNRKKALLIISDGGDNSSRYTDSEIKSLVKEADVEIYAIGIYDGLNATTEEVRGPYLLAEITEATGGRTFPINDVSAMTDVATKISVELRNKNVRRYQPTNKTRYGE